MLRPSAASASGRSSCRSCDCSASRGGRDHHRATRARGRDQVGEALADSRTGLADAVTPPCSNVSATASAIVRWAARSRKPGQARESGLSAARDSVGNTDTKGNVRAGGTRAAPSRRARPSHEGTHERRTRRDRHRRRPGRVHGCPVCRPRQPAPAGHRGLPGGRPAHDHLGRRQLPRIPRRHPRARADGADARVRPSASAPSSSPTT